MLNQIAQLFRTRVRNRRQSVNSRRRAFFGERRIAQIEQLEKREVMDATLHHIAAGNVNVVQNDTGNTVASVTVTSPYSFNGFQVRTGSNRGDYNIQIGSSATDDVAGGVLISTVNQNGRDNGEATPAAGVVHYGTAMLDGDASGYWVPMADSGLSATYAGGTEYNFNFASGYFSYADGWLGGWFRNAAGTNGGVNDLLTGHPSLQIGTHVINAGGGKTTIDLRSLGINSQTGGVLLVNGAKNEDNFALSQANANGTWTIYCKDNGADGTSYEQDYVSFVYVPLSNTQLVTGKFLGNLTNAMQSSPYTVTKTGTGLYHLEIAGYTSSQGVLLLSPDGGTTSNNDNIVTYQANGTGWDILSMDLPNSTPEDVAATDPVASFTFIPGPVMSVAPTSGLVTTESGTTATFQVVLQKQPTADVTMGLSSGDTTEGSLSVSSLTFTAANWNIPQTVTVTGVDDIIPDGDIPFTIVTSPLTSTDPKFSGVNPDDVSLTNRDNEPRLTTTASAAFYGNGDPALTVDSLATISESVATNYNNYQLVASLTAGANANDRLEIRNSGTAAGQVGVSGSNITFGGTTIGSFAGGVGSTPLTITFNNSSAPTSAQAVLRAITFRNLLSNPSNATRTVSFVLNGPGGLTSNTVTRNLQVGLMHVTEMQNGVDRGFGQYTGEVDIQLWQQNPDIAYPTGDSVSGLLVDAPAATEASQILLKYGNLFGSGPGQIPLGATIVSAELLVNVANTGQGGTLHRMISAWNDTTDTWNTFGNGSFPRNTIGGVQLDDIEARTTQESEWGTSPGGGVTGTGIVSIGVTKDLAAWSAGAVNEGWLFNGWPTRIDGTAFLPGEAADPLDRPRLKVVWVPPAVTSTSYRQGVNGYSSASDTVLRQAQPTVPAGSDLTLSTIQTGSAEIQTLLRFDDIIGTGAGQIPPGSMVHAAVLTLASTTNNSIGDGGRFIPMLQTWDAGATWDSLTNGIQTNGIEAAATFTTRAGNSTLAPDVQGGFNPFDVTADVQAWVSGTVANNGWAILPWTGGGDDWIFGSSDIGIENSRPQLKVFYTTPGVTITPTAGLATSETGGTATFTVQLDTAPSGNVTIPLSSDDVTEGTVAPASLTFTPLNWNVPQTVTITGVDDLLADGTITYNIVTGALSSTDSFYNNLNPADVSVTNTDNEVAGVAVFPATGLITTEGGGTATFTLVLNTQPTANVTIGLSSSDLTEGTVSPPIVFTTANWNVPQTVTITGVNDNQIDGNIAYTIVTAAATSSDPNYNNLAVADVSVTNQDNDVAGLTFTPSSGLKTTEAGGTASFTVVLNNQPTADVTFSLTSSNPSEGSVSASSLTFTASNWNVPQTVTLTGVDDFSTANDGAVGYAIITGVISSGDTNYNGFNPLDVTATNVDVRPLITLPEGTKQYGFGGPAVLLDFQATLVDLDSVNFNTGTLTVQTTAGGTVDDRIEVRNNGTGPGQIGVSGANVTFGGTTIGTLAGGVGTTPLVITFNSNSTPTAAEALLRAITFRNVSSTFGNSTRTVQVTQIDEAGHSSGPVSKTVLIGMQRATEFQNGSNVGNGIYNGTADIELSQTNPGTAYPQGSTPDGLVVVGSATTGNSQVLLKFDSIFGNGPGQIPPGAIITSAYLDVNVTTSGNGPVFRRMLTPWNASSDTWNSLTNGIQADNAEARTAIESTLNTAGGNGAATGAGTISVGVAADLQAWSNGETNNGWALMPFSSTTVTPFSFSPSEAAALADRPKLRVEWIPAGAASTSLRQGDNGYTGVIDTVLDQNSTATAGSGTVDLFTDFSAGTASNLATHVLMQFTNMIGSGANQVPAGSKVYAAVLLLPSMGGANTPGDGGSLRTVMQPWTAAATWANSFGGDGLQGDGTDLNTVETARAGNETRNPNAQAGYNTFDVTNDVQAWLNGTATNNGWGFLPWTSGTDGWAISSSETANVANRPKLTVYYESIVNSAPVNTAPAGPIAGIEDTNLPFALGTLSVSDADGGNLTTTVSVTGTTVGTFTASNGGGAAGVTGTGTATITLTGLQADINTALSTLIFVPAANRDTTSGATTITLSTSDGIAIDTDTFNVTLTSVNDQPSFTAVNPPAVNEDASAVSLANWATFNAGPSEASQTVVSYNLANLTNASLFAVAPSIATNGNLTYTPAANAFGTATFDLTVTDSGGNSNGGQPTSTVQTFTITVNSVNDAPSFTKGADQNVGFNAPLQTITNWATGISFGPANEAPQTVTFLVTPANPALFLTQPAIDSSGTLTFRPQTGQSGSTIVTVIAQDNGGGTNQSASQTFSINIAAGPVNAPPTIAAISNVTINEDATLQTVNLSGISYGGDVPAQAIAITATSDNPALIPNPTVVYTSPNATGSLTFTPAANLNGSATVTVTVRDSGLDLIPNNGDDGSITTTFTVTVSSVNDAPSLTLAGNQTVNEDAAAQTVNAFVASSSTGPSNESTQTLTYNIASNSNSGLFAAGPSISATGVLTYTPAANANGVATITVVAVDNGGTANGGINTSAAQSFTITINSVNDAPSLTLAGNQTVNEDAAAQTVNGFITSSSTGPSNESTQTLTYNIASNSNSGLFAAGPSISSTGVLTYTPAANASGVATITVVAVDNGGTANGGLDTSATQSFTITINSVNDAPSLALAGNQTVNEDAAAQTVNAFVTSSSTGPSNESTQTLTYNIASNSNSSLFAAGPSISATGVLTYTPAANANGVATITVVAVDNGGTANGGIDTSTTQSFTITINPVNDAPSFVKGTDLLVPFNSLAQTIPGWATAISRGAANESSETLTFNVTGNSNPSLFSVPPAIASNGTLTFTHQPGQQGSATITLRLNDSGGTANGGVDQSATQTFVITVDAPVNGLPTINAIPNLPILEDAGLQTVNLGGITAGGEVQDLQVTVTSSNPTLIPTPTLSYTSPNTTGSLTFTPAANGSGSSLITVTVRDAGFNLTLGDSDDGITTTTFTVNVTAVNDPPDASDATYSTQANHTVSGTLAATDFDGPALTYSIQITPLLGGLTSFNPSTGAFTYTPNPDVLGLDVFTFRVSDGTNFDTATVRITIQPIVPTVEPVGGDLNINGTGGRDVILVSNAGGTNALVRLQSGGFSTAATLPLTGMIHVESGAGDDYIVISGLTGPTYLDAGPDNDYVSGALGDDTIIGGSGSDQVNASGGNNVVWGDVVGEQTLAAGGDDVLSSLDGNDVMYGGGGNDQLYSGGGNDYIHAGAGNDIASAGNGIDRLFGGSGNDTLNGDGGDDVVSGGDGNDKLMGSEGNDILIAGNGVDDVNGNGGHDVLVGTGTTNDTSNAAGDANDVALLALLTSWTTTQPAALLSGLIGADDGAQDTLTGMTGDDDFYGSANDLRPDFGGSDRQWS